MANNHGFWQRVGREAEPIMAHAIVVLLLEFSLLIIGVMAWILSLLFPKEDYYFSLFAKIDLWTGLAVLCMFGAYTVIRIGIRLLRGIKDELAA